MVQCRSMLNVFDPSAGHLPELLTSDLCRKKNALPFNQTRGRVSLHFFLPSLGMVTFRKLPFSNDECSVSRKNFTLKPLFRFFFFFFPFLSLPHLSVSILPLKGCILIIVHHPSRTSTYLSSWRIHLPKEGI